MKRTLTKPILASKKTAPAVRYDEIEGKTVAGAGFGWTNMLIAFTDGTVLALRAQDEADGKQIDFEQACDINLLSRAWASEAREAGLITREQFLEATMKHDADRVARLESELASLKRNANP